MPELRINLISVLIMYILRIKLERMKRAGHVAEGKHQYGFRW